MCPQLLRHGQIFLVYPAAFLERPRAVTTPRQWGLPYKDVEIQTSDNVKLRCYFLWPRSTTGSSSKGLETQSKLSTSRLGTVIMFHGNAMNLGDFLHSASTYHALKYNVLLVSYRGYGNSDGLPSEKGLQRDAQAALDYVLDDPKLSQVPIILCGLSLGGAVAIDLASRNPSKITALIVENTFKSLPDVVHDWPLIGYFSFLCHQRWDSASKIPLLPPDLPVLMMSGAMDKVVPQKHMIALRDLAHRRGREKGRWWRKTKDVENEIAVGNTTFVSLPFGHHGDTFTQVHYWSAVESFLADIQNPIPGSPPSGT
ncbi:Alpha/Beta hydrolase protein [Collybia nuda]|uniref:Alpha/Beta hydrolase protein n=1 Tax=Collybia nuda TaxID=64659 RepID=A0A9P5XWG6_9AGAR|nr:Alpha/Beta hydrolase protein [Collybia nuda]